MVATGRVGFCIDEPCGRPIAGVLRVLRAPGHQNIADVWDLNLPGVSDEVLMIELGKLGYAAMVTTDSSILRAALRRDAWQHSGLTLFVLDGRWGNLSLFDRARRLIWWWPDLVAKAGEGPQGAAWRVAPERSPANMVRILPKLGPEPEGDTPA